MNALSCPSCGTPTTPVHGHQALCLDCTLLELDTTWDELKARTRVAEARAAKRHAGGRSDTASTVVR